jgi:hypothetical protein
VLSDSGQFPPSARLQLEQLVAGMQGILADNLIGVYLHGSLAMGCFNPDRSDLDVLAVVANGMTVEAKRRLVGVLLRLSGAPHPIEISVLRQSDLQPWECPTGYDLHYSEAWRSRVIEQTENGQWRCWNDDDTERKDADLAAHVTIARHRGVCLQGAPISQVFPAVPREHYVASILADCAWARTENSRDPVYGVLNLCRVYWYLLEERISSKAEAGEWAVGYLDGPARDAVAHALALYRGESHDERFEGEGLEQLAAGVGDAIQALAIERYPGLRLGG